LPYGQSRVFENKVLSSTRGEEIEKDEEYYITKSVINELFTEYY
jgi:hypothetical protein